jgi:hypothetical protein
LDEEFNPDQVSQLLQDAAPPGLEIHAIKVIDKKAPKIPNLVDSAKYEIHLDKPKPNLHKQIEQILSSASLVRVRRGKSYDLRPLILSIEEIPPLDGDVQRIQIHLVTRPGATGRPDEVLSTLGIPPSSAHIKRTALLLKNPAP